MASFFSRMRWPVAVTLVGALTLGGVLLTADDKDGDKAKAEQEAKDRYLVPEGTVAELKDFIQGLMAFRPSSQEEALEHRTKAMAAIGKAARQILKQETDQKSEAYQMASSLLLQIKLSKLPQMNAAQQKSLADEVLQKVAAAGEKVGRQEAGMLMMLTQSLESGDKDLAGEVSTKGGELLAKSEDKQVAGFAKMLMGTGRRLQLVGKPVQLSGETFAGEKFDMASLKGKVVLVDFWATWCGPCIGEIPNMKKNYAKYAEQGFEIVGISLDQDREALDEFLKDRELPWIILHQNDGSGQHPAAEYYGVTGIPTMFLVGRDGNVISTAARGPQLTRLLEEQFGDTKEGTDDAKADAKEGTTDGK